ncbi:MAG: M1 family metallopeptidase [Anaerolineales bacterium]
MNMLRLPPLLLLFFTFLLLTACTGPGPSAPTVAIGPTVTPNPDASPTLTPFSPPVETATSTPIPPTMTLANTPAPTATPTPTLATASPTATFPPTLTPTITLTPGATFAFVPSTYTLSVMLDYAAHSLIVDETISYQNSTGDILNGLVLAVEPNLSENCFVPGNLTVNGQAIPNATLNADRLEIPLAAPLAPDGTLSLFLHYDLHLPPADGAHVFGYNDSQINLVDWYPFIVPYIPGQGWLLHSPAIVGEHLVYDVSTFDMVLHLTGSIGTAVIAASAPAQRISYGWHYHLENVRSFAFSASPNYQTTSTKVNGVTVNSYFFGSESAQGQAVLDEVAKAVTTFDTLFGSDPYPSLSIVESPFNDGLAYDGLFFLSRDYYIANNGTTLNNLVDTAVHETAHQWWFGLVGNDQAMEPWLDEALATYSERLFYEENYPDINTWQAFRIDAYAPTGWVDSDIYHVVDLRTYTNAVYLRGVQFLQALRGRIGDEAFFAFLKDYATQMAGQRATSADFFRILRLHTNASLSDIISAYFQNPH